MSIGIIIPLVGDLLMLSLKIADIIEKSKDVSVEDKAILKAKIQEAKDSVSYWNEDERDTN